MGTTLEVFFTGKSFRIPTYQRDYAWDTGNVDDLLDDIIEAIETNTSHYIGTFILSETSRSKLYNVVDGQQRLTTLIMLFNIAINELGTPTDQIIYGDKFIRSQNDHTWRLELLNDNCTFFQEMLEGKKPSIQTRSQALLWDAYQRIKTRIMALKSKPTLSAQLLEAIKQLEVMEFIESDDGKAIRMFQTVNDRGKPLSNVEKAKSLLIYYSNRFLSGALDNYINEQFGKIFHHFTEVKTIGEQCDIEVIGQRRFSEDSVMRYHFLASADDLYDFGASESYVLDNYLKSSLKPLRGDHVRLEKFIRGYVADLSLFFESFVEILRRVTQDKQYYKLFSVLGLSARLYPLAIRLETRNLLTHRVRHPHISTMLDLLEVADVRVYKVRGTDPRADMSYLARDAKRLKPHDIEARLLSFVNNFMSDAEFSRRLNSDMYPNVVLKYIFTEYSEHLLGNEYPLQELMTQSQAVPTVEHIFAREERFDFPNFGFGSLEEYNDRVNMLGNLTLLEKSINSQCHNKPPGQKISENLYSRSMFEDAKRISAEVMNRGSAFIKTDIEERTKQIAEFCMRRWRIST
jgi:hypothetical protein